jgi:hypothetical protein
MVGGVETSNNVAPAFLITQAGMQLRAAHSQRAFVNIYLYIVIIPSLAHALLSLNIYSSRSVKQSNCNLENQLHLYVYLSGITCDWCQTTDRR